MQGIRVSLAVLAAVLVCGAGIALGADVDQPLGSGSSQESNDELSASPMYPSGPELEAKRTATSKTFRLPDGALETRIYESPIHYAEDGHWRPIEEGLEPAEGAALSNGSNGFDLDLPVRMGAGPVRLSIGGEWIAYRLLGPSSEPVQTTGNTATYETASPGLSFDFTSLANGLKEDIEIADPSQPNTFSFELSASAGLEPTLTEEGEIEFRDRSDELVGTMPAPIMSDSSAGPPKVSRDVRYELEPQDGGQWLLTVQADRDWLSQTARIWPVEIDPTLTVPSPALDCTIGGHKGENGWGKCGSSGHKYLFAGYKPVYGSEAADEWFRSLLRFDLSAIPANAYVDKATVGLHAPGTALNTIGIEVYHATKSWTNKVDWRRYNGTALWAKEGGDFASDAGNIFTGDRGTQPGWWNISDGMVGLVTDWVSGEAPNQGLMVKLMDDESRECEPGVCTERFIAFDSSASSDTSKRPYMSVTYYPPAPSASRVSSPSEGTQTARRLKLQAKWSAAGTTGVTFQYRAGNSGPFTTILPELVQDAEGQEVNWPMAVQGNESEPIYFDALNADAEVIASGGKIQVRALFEGPIGVDGYSEPVKAIVDPNIGGTRDATAEVGPGTVNLLTGNLTVSKTDISIPVFDSALEFSRAHNSRDGGKAADTGVLGRGWKPTVPVEEAGGAAWQKAIEVVASAQEKEEGLGNYVLLTDLEGYEYAFEPLGSTYVSPPGAK